MKYAIGCLVVMLISGCDAQPVLKVRPMSHQRNNGDAWVVRTDFSNDEKWESVCALISRPQGEDGFFAYVQYKDDPQLTDLDPAELVHSLPDDYSGFLCFVVDAATLSSDEHPILVIDFSPDSLERKDYLRTPGQTPLADIKTFRAIPSTIQSIENNLSLANMDFEEFADAVDDDGVYRGFR